MNNFYKQGYAETCRQLGLNLTKIAREPTTGERAVNLLLGPFGIASPVYAGLAAPEGKGLRSAATTWLGGMGGGTLGGLAGVSAGALIGALSGRRALKALGESLVRTLERKGSSLPEFIGKAEEMWGPEAVRNMRVLATTHPRAVGAYLGGMLGSFPGSLIGAPIGLDWGLRKGWTHGDKE